MEDDNKLVTLEELEEEEKVVTEWDNVDKLKYSKDQMDKLMQVKFVSYSQEVIDTAIGEVLRSVGFDEYESFRYTIDSILTGTRIPFSLRTKDKLTGNMDFWLVRTFINVQKNSVIVHEEKEYNKKEVLVSKQFCDTLRKFCKEQLNDEVQFWFFTTGMEGAQNLDMSKFSNSDKTLLSARGDNNPDDLILYQFKKKHHEIMVGKE
jgi:hypothetical protein